MIRAQKEKLDSYFVGNIQLIVPFFQRSYVWDKDNWVELWEHTFTVLERYEESTPGEHEHFIGTIIAKRADDQGILGENKYDLIDGQQRLTTISLLLKAIGDASTGEMGNLAGSITEKLQFTDSRGDRFNRIRLSDYDLPYYEAVMNGNRTEKMMRLEHRIFKAYDYFRDNLSGFSDERLDRLSKVVLHKVPVIHMMLEPNDDEQEIFDTVNALGVRLTTAELLKNYIFKAADVKPLYKTLWRDVFEGSEELIDFWGTPKTAGRVIRTNLEVLLYCYLIIKTGKEVKLEKLYKEYKNWLGGKTTDEKSAFLEELKAYADCYFSLPSGTELNQMLFGEREKRFFHILENLSITTAYPLVFFIYKNISDTTVRLEMLGLLESYLVRRNVCKLTTKNYNQLFIQMVNKLKNRLQEEGSFPTESLKEIIQNYTEQTNKMPSDSDFRISFGSVKLSNANAREILFILALKQVKEGLADIPNLSLGNYSVEHMMPVKWHANWMDREMNELEIAERDNKLRTLGNLTLVTKRLNSKMQNAAWADKKSVLETHSTLRMTRNYLGDTWDESEITERSENLCDDALQIWPRYF